MHPFADADQPQFIFLHGAGLGSWIWDAVTPKLQFAGTALDLPGRSNSKEISTVGLAQCVDLVAATLRPKSILVGHSFSAPIVLAVAARYPDMVSSVVIIGGVIPESGKSFVSTLPFIPRVLMSTYIKLARKGVNLPDSLIQDAYCNDLDQAKTAMVVHNTIKEAPRFYLDQLNWSALPDRIPRIYIKLLDDKSLTQEQQDTFANRLKGVQTVSLRTGHLPMISQPEMLANVLNRVGVSVIKTSQNAFQPA